MVSLAGTISVTPLGKLNCILSAWFPLAPVEIAFNVTATADRLANDPVQRVNTGVPPSMLALISTEVNGNAP